MPILDRLFLKNPYRLWKSKHGYSNSNTPVVEFAKRRMAESNDEKDGTKVDGEAPRQRDFLSRFREAHRKNPAFISEERVLALTVANMFAGSDTTAISLRAVFYHLLRRPAALDKLVAELEETEEKKRKEIISSGDESSLALPRWSDVRDLPYLGAVINEALRVHPAAGLPLERVVPQGGVSVSGAFLPAGTIVGCNAWALHRDEAVFGEDVGAFRPERWLEGSEARRAEMKNCLFAFGAGARTCVGKNISLLEMYKLVPAVLLNFEVCCSSSC